MKYDLNLLIVDDVESIREGMGRIMKRFFKNCFLASSGIEALKICEKETINILITDIVMPEMDGLTLIKHVTEKYPYVKPILVISGQAAPEVLDEIEDIGIHVFTKPLDVDSMLDYIQAAL